ncbi:unnamed protein product [Phytophthora fragariaefolia]|uniref:Unnamed protein product n=1 Tax=Phytophthora fragariaefolia TaxID=1490495 RepID=A0A9W7CUN5_9STRA|nr:unnamed protein product [Phytophthora fragariaefolia]
MAAVAVAMSVIAVAMGIVTAGLGAVGIVMDAVAVAMGAVTAGMGAVAVRQTPPQHPLRSSLTWTIRWPCTIRESRVRVSCSPGL